MTEKEWLACGAPNQMEDALKADLSPRKRRLFGCACCRRVWSSLRDLRSRTAVEVAERFADGFATANALTGARERAWTASQENARSIVDKRMDERVTQYRGTRACAQVVADDVPFPFTGWWDVANTALDAGVRWHDELGAICGLIRCIFGNPFRSAPVLDAAWLTSDVKALGKGMYESRDFSVMPILADALQDAGCDNDDILNHCRDPQGVHARGCWVVDLVLGKS